MSEFHEARILRCPGCGKQFASCEGPLCSCEEDARDVLDEMSREEEEYLGNCIEEEEKAEEAFDNGPFGVGA